MESPAAMQHVRTPYQYEPLRSIYGDFPGFRLLHLWAGGEGDELAGTLRLYELASEHTPEYESLSYRWQSRDQSKYLLLDGTRIEIHHNLWRILRVLRRSAKERILWADAICIDQENDQEKSNQVGLMGAIYSRAGHVNIWLGEAAEGSDALFQWAAGHQRAEHATKPPVIVEAALLHLSQRSYWSRAWIVQECVLAREIVVYCGNMSLGWDTLIQRCSPVLAGPRTSTKYEHQKGLRQEDEPQKAIAIEREQALRTLTIDDDTSPLDAFGFWKMLIETRNDFRNGLTNVRQNADRKTDKAPLQAKTLEGMPFLRLLSRFNKCESSVPLDRIYAFVPFASLVCDSATSMRDQSSWLGIYGPPLRQCNHLFPKEHGAITPDYSLTFRRAVIRLALAQGLENAVEAWNAISSIFQEELAPYRTASFLNLPPPGAQITPDERSILFHELCREYRVGSRYIHAALTAPQMRNQFLEAYLEWSLFSSPSQAEPNHDSEERQEYDRYDIHQDGALFSRAWKRCLEFLEDDSEVRFRKWHRILRIMVPPGEQETFIKTCLPFWRWKNEQSFDLPRVDFDKSFKINEAQREEVLYALWGAEPWPSEAYQLVVERGWKSSVQEASPATN